MNSILLAILTGGVAAAGVKLIDNLVQWILGRRAKKQDEENADKKAIEKQEEMQKCADAELQRAIAEGMKWVLYDRIKFLGMKYISDHAVDFDDRRLLHEMHKVYHYGLHGNGDLDLIMTEVDALPQRT